MVIYFLRHGDALTSSQYHDSDRPLSDLGRTQITLIATFLHRTKTSINIILTSPFTRACESGEIIQSFVHAPKIEKTEYLVNGSNPRQLFSSLADYDAESALLVGHEPFLSDTISLLLTGERLIDIEMKKGSLACLEIQDVRHPGTGTLKYLISVDSLLKILIA